MPILTNPRHERFAQELAKGKTAGEAYQAAGYRPSRPAASRLSTNVNIRARVDELQSRVAEGIVLTKQWVIEKLVQNVNRAMQEEEIQRGGEGTGEFKYDGAVANKALELLGKELGMFIDRSENVNIVHDISSEPLTADEWAATHGTAH